MMPGPSRGVAAIRPMAIAVVVIVIIAAIALSVIGYQQYREREAVKDLQFSVSEVKIESVNLTTASLNFTLRITNPSSNAATIDRTTYAVSINNISLGNGENAEKVTIPAGGTVYVPQPFTASNSGTAQGAWAYLTQDTVEWRIVGTAYFDTFLGTVSAGYDYNGTTSGA